MNILVTGSNGQVGTELRDLVKNLTPSEDNDNYIFTAKEGNGDDILTLDITDELAVKSFVKDNFINVIVNCAAYTKVDAAEIEYEIAKAINEDAPRYLAEAANQNGAVLIHLSTDYVFNGQTFLPYVESHAKLPLNVYGRTKANGEYNVINSGCNYIIIRTQWLYSNNGKNFFKTMFEKLWKKKHNPEGEDILNIVNDQLGTPTSAREVAIAIFHIINHNKDKQTLSKTGIYHFRNEGTASWYDFAWEISELIDKYVRQDPPAHLFLNPVSTSDYNRETEKKGKTIARRPLYAVLNTDKFKNTFDFTPHHWRQELEVVFGREIAETNKK